MSQFKSLVSPNQQCQWFQDSLAKFSGTTLPGRGTEMHFMFHCTKCRVWEMAVREQFLKKDFIVHL